MAHKLRTENEVLFAFRTDKSLRTAMKVEAAARETTVESLAAKLLWKGLDRLHSDITMLQSPQHA
jgi:hypothetical protein